MSVYAYFMAGEQRSTVFRVKERLWILAISDEDMSWDEDVDDRHSPNSEERVEQTPPQLLLPRDTVVEHQLLQISLLR